MVPCTMLASEARARGSPESREQLFAPSDCAHALADQNSTTVGRRTLLLVVLWNRGSRPRGPDPRGVQNLFRPHQADGTEFLS